MKSSPPIWHLLHNVKSMVKILSNFVAFIENTNFNKNWEKNLLGHASWANWPRREIQNSKSGLFYHLKSH